MIVILTFLAICSLVASEDVTESSAPSTTNNVPTLYGYDAIVDKVINSDLIRKPISGHTLALEIEKRIRTRLGGRRDYSWSVIFDNISASPSTISRQCDVTQRNSNESLVITIDFGPMAFTADLNITVTSVNQGSENSVRKVKATVNQGTITMILKRDRNHWINPGMYKVQRVLSEGFQFYNFELDGGDDITVRSLKDFKIYDELQRNLENHFPETIKFHFSRAFKSRLNRSS